MYVQRFSPSRRSGTTRDVRDRVLEQATGVLTLVYRTAPEDALQRLADAAKRHAVEPCELARAVVAVASGCAPPTPEFQDVIDREWGDLLL